MRALETSYGGCRFRSRLEARWAVFFDHLGLKWDYEPQGFELVPVVEGQDHLGCYLPDFWLPGPAAWFEVKGTNPDVDGWARLTRFASQMSRGHRLLVAVGSMPDPRRFDGSGHPYDGVESAFDIEVLEGVGGDVHYAWCVCPGCGAVGIEFDGRGARIHEYRRPWDEGVGWEDLTCSDFKRDDDKHYSGDHPRILAAYRAARSARFEHGESP